MARIRNYSINMYMRLEFFKLIHKSTGIGLIRYFVELQMLLNYNDNYYHVYKDYNPVISTFQIQRAFNIQKWLICFPTSLLIFACLQSANVLEYGYIDKHIAIFLYIRWDVFDTGLFCAHKIFLTIREIRNINLTI